MWDTAGQECFNTLHPSYYFGAHAAILVFNTVSLEAYSYRCSMLQEKSHIST